MPPLRASWTYLLNTALSNRSTASASTPPIEVRSTSAGACTRRPRRDTAAVRPPLPAKSSRKAGRERGGAGAGPEAPRWLRKSPSPSTEVRPRSGGPACEEDPWSTLLASLQTVSKAAPRNTLLQGTSSTRSANRRPACEARVIPGAAAAAPRPAATVPRPEDAGGGTKPPAPATALPLHMCGRPPPPSSGVQLTVRCGCKHLRQTWARLCGHTFLHPSFALFHEKQIWEPSRVVM